MSPLPPSPNSGSRSAIERIGERRRKEGLKERFWDLVNTLPRGRSMFEAIYQPTGHQNSQVTFVYMAETPQQNPGSPTSPPNAKSNSTPRPHASRRSNANYTTPPRTAPTRGSNFNSNTPRRSPPRRTEPRRRTNLNISSTVPSPVQGLISALDRLEEGPGVADTSPITNDLKRRIFDMVA